MPAPPLKVAWISDFSIEWLDGLPSALAGLPRQHPLTWQRVLLEEFTGRPEVELHVIVLRKGIERDVAFERKGVRFQVLKTRGLTRAPSLYWTDTWMIHRALGRIQPDVVHAWGTERGAALVGLRLPWPCLVTIQGLLGWYRTQVKLKPVELLAAWLEDRALNRARHVSGESTFTVSYLRERYPKLTVHHVEHVPGREFHQVRRKPQIHPLRLLFAGHLDGRKGADVLLAALERLSGELQFELAHAGSSDADQMAKWSRFAAGGRYLPLGRLIPGQMADELAQATLALMPTRADTGPVAVKEAAVAGVPVVATAVGGIPDYVTHGENGWLIPSADTKELAEALRVVSHHPVLGQGQVAPATLARVRDYLSPQRMAEGFLTTYVAVRADWLRR